MIKKTKIEIYTDLNFIVLKKNLKEMIYQMIAKLNKNFEKVIIIFLTDEQLLEYNKKFLNHNYYTDILTFVYNEKEPFIVEIYISYERALENSKKYKSTIENEILRLITHGLLHTIGYTDYTRVQKQIMRKAENDLITNINKINFVKKIDLENVTNG